MTLELVPKAFPLLREIDGNKAASPMHGACLIRPLSLGTGKYVYSTRVIDITFISHSLMPDIDECAAQVNPCNTVAHSVCKNTEGSYSCPCKVGFVKKGDNCKGTV